MSSAFQGKYAQMQLALVGGTILPFSINCLFFVGNGFSSLKFYVFEEATVLLFQEIVYEIACLMFRHTTSPLPFGQIFPYFFHNSLFPRDFSNLAGTYLTSITSFLIFVEEV